MKAERTGSDGRADATLVGLESILVALTDPGPDRAAVAGSGGAKG